MFLHDIMKPFNFSNLVIASSKGILFSVLLSTFLGLVILLKGKKKSLAKIEVNTFNAA